MQEDLSQEETKTPTPAAETPKADRAETSYVILSQGASTSWEVADEGFPARSAEAAVRAFAEKIAIPGNGVTLVAIPSRSWRPVKVTTKVETTLVIEP